MNIMILNPHTPNSKHRIVQIVPSFCIVCVCIDVWTSGKKREKVVLKGIGRLTEGKGGRKDKEVGGLRWDEVRELQTRLTASFQILFGT